MIAPNRRIISKTHRSGAAFLLLVVALVLVVMGATQAMLRGEITSQRNRQRQLQTDSLQRAIVAAISIDHDWKSPLSFPIDDEQQVTVSADKEQTQLTATWMRGENIENTVRRTFASFSNAQPKLARPASAEQIDAADRPSDPEI